MFLAHAVVSTENSIKALWLRSFWHGRDKLVAKAGRRTDAARKETNLKADVHFSIFVAFGLVS